MKLMNKLMKSIFAFVMIAALASCSMGGVEGTSTVKADDGIYLSVSIDQGRTALPQIVEDDLKSFNYELKGSLKTDVNVSIEVSAESFDALNHKLETTNLRQAGEWGFTLKVFNDYAAFNAATDQGIVAGQNNVLTFSLGLDNVTSNSNGKIVINLDKGDNNFSIAKAYIYAIGGTDEPIVRTLSDDLTSDAEVLAGSYKVVIKLDDSLYTIEYAIVLGGFDTIVTGAHGVVIHASTNNSSADENSSSSSIADSSNSSSDENSSSSSIADSSNSSGDENSSSSSIADSSNSSGDENSSSSSIADSSNSSGDENSSSSSIADSSSADDSSSGDEYPEIYVVGFNNDWEGSKMSTTDGVNYTVTMTAASNVPTEFGMKLNVDKDWDQQYVRADVFTMTYRKKLYVEPNQEVLFTTASNDQLNQQNNAQSNIDDNSKIFLKYPVAENSEVTVNFSLDTMKVSVAYTPSSEEIIDSVSFNTVTPYFESGIGEYALNLDSNNSTESTKVYTTQFVYDAGAAASGEWNYSTADLGFLIARAETEWSKTFFTQSNITVGTESTLIYTDYMEPLCGIDDLEDGKKYDVKVTITVPESQIWSDCTVKILVSEVVYEPIYVAGWEGIWLIESDDPTVCPEMTTDDGINYSLTIAATSVNPTPYGIRFVSKNGYSQQYVRADMLNMGDTVDKKYVESDEEVLFTETNATPNGQEDNGKIYLKERVNIGDNITINFSLTTMKASVTYTSTGVGVNDYCVDSMTPGFNSSIGNNSFTYNANASSGNVYVFEHVFTYSRDLDTWGCQSGTIEFGVTEVQGTWMQKFTGASSMEVGTETTLNLGWDANNKITGLIEGETYRVVVTATANENGKKLWSECSVKCVICVSRDTLDVSSPGFNSSNGNIALTLDENSSTDYVQVFTGQFTYSGVAESGWNNIAENTVEFGITEAIGQWQQKFTGASSMEVGTEATLNLGWEANNKITGLTVDTTYNITVTVAAYPTYLWSKCIVKCLIEQAP